MLIRASFAAAALGLAASALAQAPAQPASTAPKTIAKADFIKNLDARFAALDANRDGAISESEIQAAQAKALTQLKAAQQQQLEAEFKKLDTDKSGSLSLVEFKSAARPLKSPDSDDAMTALDKNKDGKVTADEYRAPRVAAFDKLDADRNGVLTEQEAAAARNR